MRVHMTAALELECHQWGREAIDLVVAGDLIWEDVPDFLRWKEKSERGRVWTPGPDDAAYRVVEASSS